MSKRVVQDISEHAVKSYPYECCGLLLGSISDKKVVHESARMENIFPGDRMRRYSIDPLKMLRVEEKAEEKGMKVVGIYHSHPDYPPVPSSYDLNNAWPFYSYVIVSVTRGKVNGIESWILEEEGNKRRFVREELREV